MTKRSSIISKLLPGLSFSRDSVRHDRFGVKPRRRKALRLESLEKRQLLAAIVIAPVDADLIVDSGSYLDYGSPLGSLWYDGSGLSDASIVETGDPVPTVWPEHVAGNSSSRVSRIRNAPEFNTLTFDLGGTFDVSGMVLWNSTEDTSGGLQTDRGFENTRLSYSTDGGNTFTGDDLLVWTERSADASINQGPNPSAPIAMFGPEVQMLPSAVAGVTHVRMVVDNFSDAGLDNIVMASEIRFLGESQASVPTPGVYLEDGGLVVMETENTTSDLGLWQEKTDYSGYTGDGYLQFFGNNYQSGPANSPMEYRFRITTPGLYYLHLRSAKDNSADPSRNDISNDIYVRVEGDYNAGPGPYDSHLDNASLSLLQSDTKFFGGAMNSFKWDSGAQLDPGGHNNKRVAVYNFKAGEEYTLVVSGRSKFYSIDRIVLRHTDTAVSLAQNLNTPESQRVPLQGSGDVAITGELKQWHKTTLTLEGPQASEDGATNPFMDYRMNVTFTHPATGTTYTVPGYFAADGDAANTGATSGNKWRAHLSPDFEGQWNYSISFRTGNNVAVNDSPTAGTVVAPFDGITGSFVIGATDKTGDDFRAKGRLEYVGEHYLRFAGTGEYFIKQGPDAPENLLAYEDFDGPFQTDGNYNRGTFGSEAASIKSYAAHQQDWNAGDPSWAGGKGTELIGALNYLASEELNSVSFLTMNIIGDDKNVFPYTDYNERERMDVSRLDQWEIVFEHGTEKGLHLHFKTQETENDQLLDGGDLGPERKLYYRELIARFSHHLALNWNLGEETTNTPQQAKDFAQYFHDNDPYQHNIVLHTYAAQKDQRYGPLLGSASELTGLSLQTNQVDFSLVHGDTATWVANSAAAGKKWVVAVDEPGDAQHSLRPDNDAGNSHVDGRKNALWGTLMAGGAGNEWYFGYGHAHSDLTLEDFRSRDQWWDYTRYAKSFFEDFDIPFWEMTNDNSISTASDDYGFYKEGEVYTVYLKNGGTTSLDLSAAPANEVFNVKWFDPRNGGVLQDGSVTQVNGGGTVSLGLPPNSTNEDWAILVTSEFFVPGLAIDGVFLVNADDDSDIGPLTDGMVINLATLESANLNVRVTTEGAAGSVGFELIGATAHSQSETVAPYALFGDAAGDYNVGTFSVGQHTLVVTPYSEAGLNGTAGEAVTVHFVVSDGNLNNAPTGSVTIAGTLTEGQTLTASNTLADADGLGTISYQWQRNGVDVFGATGSTYALGATDVGTKISVVASYTDGGGKLEQVNSSVSQAATYGYIARTDFPILDAGEVDYYADNGNDALAINAAIVANRDKFARASHTFTGDSGIYPVRITTLTEEDGESVYRLLVNGTVVGTYQNPYIGPGSTFDLQPNQHVWNDVALHSGDTISIESNSATNGEIPEGDGTAWARGRWRSLELFTGVGPVMPDNSTPSIDGLYLVNADTDADIVALTDGAIINFATLETANLNVRATTSSSVGSVGFQLSGAATHNQTETIAPYALFGDASGDFNAGVLAVGQYTLVVTPYSEGGLGGTAYTATTVNFEVVDDAGLLQQPFVERTVQDGTRIEAEAFDNGGEGIAYSDSNVDNNGNVYRTSESVDIGNTDDGDSLYAVGWVSNGEWLEYSADVVAGTYDIHFRVAELNNNVNSIKLLVANDTDPATPFTELGMVDVPQTGGHGVYTTVTLEDIDLSSWAGENRVFRLEFSGSGFNVNWFEFVTPAVPATVVGRGIAYAGATAAYGENAVDPTKSALRGQGTAATTANYTNYVKGLNRVMVDIADLPVSNLSSTSDFEFRVGNTDDPSQWTLLSGETLPTISPAVDLGDGVSRVALSWADAHAIKNSWLQVTVKATENTGLEQDDVFYFGNQVGDVDGSTSGSGRVTVNAFDALDVRFNQSPVIDSIDMNHAWHVYDVDRSGAINAFDSLDVRFNQMPTGGLKMITLPVPVTPPAPQQSLALQQNPINRLDVNGDGEITALDALVGINFLSSRDALGEQIEATSRPYYYDVNGDGHVSAVDVLQIINSLDPSTNSEGEFVANHPQKVLTRPAGKLDWSDEESRARETAFDLALMDWDSVDEDRDDPFDDSLLFNQKQMIQGGLF